MFGAVGLTVVDIATALVVDQLAFNNLRGRSPFRSKGLDEVERATLTWVEWFNNRRLLQPIGDVPPVEYENLYYQQAESVQHDSNKTASDKGGAIHHHHDRG